MKYFLFMLFLLPLCHCQEKTKQDRRTAAIYLNNEDSTNLEADSLFLANLPYVTSVEYVSKEEAKQKYLDAGNQDWSHVLEENPLPASYNIVIAVDRFPFQGIDSFKNMVKRKISNCSDILVSEIFSAGD